MPKFISNNKIKKELTIICKNDCTEKCPGADYDIYKVHPHVWCICDEKLSKDRGATPLTYNKSGEIAAKLQHALMLSCIVSAQKLGRIPRHVGIGAWIGVQANWTVVGERHCNNGLDSAAGWLLLEFRTTIIILAVACLASGDVALAWPTAGNFDTFDPETTKALSVAWTALYCLPAFSQDELGFRLSFSILSVCSWKPSFALNYFLWCHDFCVLSTNRGYKVGPLNTWQASHICCKRSLMFACQRPCSHCRGMAIK